MQSRTVLSKPAEKSASNTTLQTKSSVENSFAKDAVPPVSVHIPFVFKDVNVFPQDDSRPSNGRGNGACKSDRRSIHAKLQVGSVDDPLEHEADRTAARVMRMSESQSVEACSCGGTCPKCGQVSSANETLKLSRVAGTNSAVVGDAPAIVQDTLRSPGKPLDASTRAFMEPRFGYDFSRVRIHADSNAAGSARAIGARAYTVSHDIVLAESDTSRAHDYRTLLAHELTHVVQGDGSELRVRRAPFTFGTSTKSPFRPQEELHLEMFGETCAGCHQTSRKKLLRTITNRSELFEWAVQLRENGKTIEAIKRELYGPTVEATDDDREKAAMFIHFNQNSIEKAAKERQLQQLKQNLTPDEYEVQVTIPSLMAQSVRDLSPEVFVTAAEKYRQHLSRVLYDLETDYKGDEERRSRTGFSFVEWASASDFPKLPDAWFSQLRTLLAQATTDFNSKNFSKALSNIQLVEGYLKYGAQQVAKYEGSLDKWAGRIVTALSIVRDTAFMIVNVYTLGEAGPIQALLMGTSFKMFQQSAEHAFGQGEGINPASAVESAMVDLITAKMGQMIHARLAAVGIDERSFGRYVGRENTTNALLGSAQLLYQSVKEATTLGEALDNLYDAFFSPKASFEMLMTNMISEVLTRRATGPVEEPRSRPIESSVGSSPKLPSSPKTETHDQPKQTAAKAGETPAADVQTPAGQEGPTKPKPARVQTAIKNLETERAVAASAKRLGIPLEQAEREVAELNQEADNAVNVHKPADARYDAEMTLPDGRITYKRRRGQTIWDRCWNPCEEGGVVGPEVEKKVNSVQKSAQPGATGAAPASPDRPAGIGAAPGRAAPAGPPMRSLPGGAHREGMHVGGKTPKSPGQKAVVHPTPLKPSRPAVTHAKGPLPVAPDYSADPRAPTQPVVSSVKRSYSAADLDKIARDTPDIKKIREIAKNLVSGAKGSLFERWGNLHVFERKNKVRIEKAQNAHLEKHGGLLAESHVEIDNYDETGGDIWDTKIYSKDSQLDSQQLHDYRVMEQAGEVMDSKGRMIPVKGVNYLFSDVDAALEHATTVWVEGGGSVFYLDDAGDLVLLSPGKR